MFKKRGFQDGGFGGKSGGSRFGGARDWDRGSRGGRDEGFKQMHRATCATCGESCEVPFKPNGSRPVLCSNCFKRDGQSAPKRFDRRDARDSFERPSFGGSRSSGPSMDEINAKLDQILKLLKGED